MDRNSIRGKIYELYRQGKTPKHIAVITGLPLQTVYELTRDIPKDTLSKTELENKLKFMPDFPARWVDAVNPVRRYYGLKPMVLEDVKTD